MNTHEKIYELLTGFALGELSEQQENEVKAHLAECEQCCKETQRLVALVNYTEQVGTVAAGEDVCTSAKLAVLGSVAGNETSTLSRKRISLENLGDKFMSKITARPAIAAAVILACTIGITVLAYQNVSKKEQFIAQGEPDEGLGNTEAPSLQGTLPTRDSQLAEDIKRVEQMFAAGDTDGLVAMMAAADYETKAAAANYLSQMGDIAALEMLEVLSKSNGDTNDSFASAAADVREKLTISGAIGTTQQAEIAGSVTEPASDDLLGLLPAETLFCVRINNLEDTLGAIDQFITGVSPMPGGATIMVRMGLAGLVGDPALNGIDTKANFAAFGAVISSQADEASPSDVVVAVAVPVSDYAGLLETNTKLDPPDANGVIRVHGGIGGANKTMLAVQSGPYMLISPQSDYTKVVALRDAPKGAALAGCLEAGEIRNAAEEAVWAYVDIQRTARVFSPFVDKGLDQIGKQLKQANAANQAPTMVDPNGVVNMYAGIINILRNEVQYISLGLRPKAEMCHVTFRMKAVPETLMAKMLAGQESSSANNLLGYLEDDALFNGAVMMNTSFWEELTLTNFDIVRFLSNGAVSEEAMAKLETIIADMIASSGGPAVISVEFNRDSVAQMPFAARYVVSVKDAEKWNKAQQDLIQLYVQGSLADVYRDMGMEFRQEIERGIDTYRGVSIDSIRQVVIPTDPNSEEGKILAKMYTGGYDSKTAVYNGLWLSAMGPDCDDGIRTLIDKVVSGGSGGIAPSVQACFDRLHSASQLDFVGTVNVAEYLQMATAAMDFMMADPNNPPPLPAGQYSQSIAYGGRVAEGRLRVEMAIPKKHMAEVRESAQSMSQKATEFRRTMQNRASDPNATGETSERMQALPVSPLGVQ